MPHDKNGKLIEVGAQVMVRDGYYKGRLGHVVKVHPGAELCNVEIAVLQPSVSVAFQTGNAKDVEVIE